VRLVETEDLGLSEAERVERWRRLELQRAGCPNEIARRIAASHADLHLAVTMLRQGCKPRLLEKILT
jgi:hypothetical protein